MIEVNELAERASEKVPEAARTSRPVEHAEPHETRPREHQGAAAQVPHSNFTGNRGSRALGLDDLAPHAEAASTVLNGAHVQRNGPKLAPADQGPPFFDSHGANTITNRREWHDSSRRDHAGGHDRGRSSSQL